MPPPLRLGGTFALFSLLRRAINLQFDVSGPDLPSDYLLTHYSTAPRWDGGEPAAYEGASGASHLRSREEGVSSAMLDANRKHRGSDHGSGLSHPGGYAPPSGALVNGQRSTVNEQTDVERGRMGGKRDWRQELGKSFFLRKVISVMVVTGASVVRGCGGGLW